MNMKKKTFSLKLLLGLLGLASLTLASTSSAGVMYLHTPDGIPYSSEQTSSFVNLYKNNVSINMLDSSGIEARILEFGPTAPSNAIWVEPSEPLDATLIGRSGMITFGDQLQYNYLHVGRFWSVHNSEESAINSDVTNYYAFSDLTMMAPIDVAPKLYLHDINSLPTPADYTNTDACLLTKGTLPSANAFQAAPRTVSTVDVKPSIESHLLVKSIADDAFIKLIEADWITLSKDEPEALLFNFSVSDCAGPTSYLLPWPVLYTIN